MGQTYSRPTHTLRGLFVGIVPPITFKNMGELKRLLLMFDRLALDMGSGGPMTVVEKRILDMARKEMDWMGKEQLLTTLNGLAAAAGTSRLAPSIPVLGGDFLEPGYRGGTRLLGQAGGTVKVISGRTLRITAAELREKHGVDAVAVPNSLESENVDAPAGHEAVIRITLREFPVLYDSTPWQSVVEFRMDKEVRSQFSRLKNWINNVARNGLKEYEIADELREMIHEYQLGMNYHKMKAAEGELKVVLTTNIDVAESLTRMQMSGASKNLFSITDYQLNLLDEERRTPGREIAYIVSAKASFGA